MRKQKTEDFLAECVSIADTVTTLLLAVTICAIVSPKTLLNVLFEANQDITISKALGAGLAIYLIFRFCEIAHPTSSIKHALRYLYNIVHKPTETKKI